MEYVYYRKALFRDNAPLSAANTASVDGFTIDGIQPTGTDRKVVFSYSGAATASSGSTTTTTETENNYFKLTIDSDGKATVSSLATQDITENSVLAEGNSVAELLTVKSIPEWVGKTIYPIIAMSAPEDATTVPTIKLGIQVTGSNEQFEKDEESPIFKLADSNVDVISVDANVSVEGKGTATVQVKFCSGGSWSNYMNMVDAKNIKAQAVQFNAHYAVSAIGGTDKASVKDVTIIYNASAAKVSGSTAEIITQTMHFAEEPEKKGVSFAQCLIKHKALRDAEIKAYATFRTEPQTREMVSIGTGTGQEQTVKLSDTGINHNSIKVQFDGVPYYGFAYNTETNEITFTADKSVAVTASYEYGWEEETWNEMTQISSQLYDNGNYATRFQYTLPTGQTDKTITAVKYELIRPEGDIQDVLLGTGTGDTQVFILPHLARKDTIVCTGVWSYDDETRVLKVMAEKGTDIKVSYHWVAESHEIYGITAGWAETA